MRPIDADDVPTNADWAKTTWDLPIDKAKFLEVLRLLHTTVAEFKQLPIYQANLDKVPWLRELEDDAE